MKRMKRSYVLTAEELEPHGMRCPYCDREPFEPGEEAVKFLEGMIGDVPVVLSGVCPECAEKIEVWSLLPCADCGGSGEAVLGYVTRDMATDAGEPSMEGMPVPGQCPTCRGSGDVIGTPKASEHKSGETDD